jgi:hypothetical protein
MQPDFGQIPPREMITPLRVVREQLLLIIFNFPVLLTENLYVSHRDAL